MDWTYFWQVNLNAPATLPNPSYYTHMWQEERKKTTNLVQKNVKWPLFCQRFVAIYCHQRDSFWSDQPKFMRYIHIHTFRNIIIVSLWSACLLLEVTHGGKVTHTNWTKKKKKKKELKHAIPKTSSTEGSVWVYNHDCGHQKSLLGRDCMKFGR